MYYTLYILIHTIHTNIHTEARVNPGWIITTLFDAKKRYGAENSEHNTTSEPFINDNCYKSPHRQTAPSELVKMTLSHRKNWASLSKNK